MLYRGSLRIDLQPNQLNGRAAGELKGNADLSTTLPPVEMTIHFESELRVSRTFHGNTEFAFNMNCHLDRSAA